MKRVLVCGAGGLIGSRTLAPLTQLGFEVHALSGRSLPADVKRHEVDLLDRRRTAELLAQIRPTHLLHLAWYVEHGLFWSAAENLSWAAASLDLLRAFAEQGGQRAAIAGTCAEYAWDDDRARYAEDAPTRPATLYGAAKHALQVTAQAYAPLSVAWGRLFLVYGPGEAPPRLVPSLALPLLRGESAPMGSGAAVRDLLHVDDVGRALAALLDSELEGPVNVASGHGVALREVGELIARAVGPTARIELGALPDRPGEPASLVAATERLNGELGWAPQIALEQGIAQTVEWWRAQ